MKIGGTDRMFGGDRPGGSATSAPGQGALATRTLSKRYGSIVAGDAVDLDLPAGSFFSLLGPSGCGKTNPPRMIGGLEPPGVGREVVGGLRRGRGGGASEQGGAVPPPPPRPPGCPLREEPMSALDRNV